MRRDTLSFGIPAHNGGRGPAPEFARWADPEAALERVVTAGGYVEGAADRALDCLRVVA